MNSTTQAIRAISAVFLRRILRFAFIVLVIALVAIYGALTYTALEYSLWILVFLIVLLPVTLLLIVVCSLLWFFTSRLMPRRLSTTEHKQIVEFTDKIASVIERGQTPYAIAVFFVIKDIVRKRDSKFLKELITDSKSLRGDFSKIKELF